MRNPLRELGNSLSKRCKGVPQDSEPVISEFSLAKAYTMYFLFSRTVIIWKKVGRYPYKYKWENR